MKAVIMAAGKSTRTEPLTLTRPKPLLKIANKEIIKHTLDMLEGIVDEAILIVGYKKDMIIESIGSKHNDIKVQYLEQTEQRGTGHAVSLVRDFVDEEFILIGGDDIFSKEGFETISEEEFAILGKEFDNIQEMGELVKNDDGSLKEIVEKPKNPKSNLASIGCYKLTPKVFEYFDDLKESEREELEFVDVMNALAKDVSIKIIETESWVPVSYAWNLLDANEHVLKTIKEKIQGNIEDNVTIKGDVIIGEGTILKNGTYIEGPAVIGKNCRIGPNCYIRSSTSIGDNCHIGQAVEIKNTIIGNNSNVPHLNYIGDSVIGDNCNLGAGTKCANLRHDNANVKSVIKGKLIDSRRRKFGTIIADGVHTGINTSIYPGRKFWPGTSTIPGEVVKEDVKE